MSETAVAPAPSAASTPAPAAAPSAAPVSTPAAPTPAVAAPQQTWGTQGVTTTVDPTKYAGREQYAEALLAEKMAAIPADTETVPTETAEVAVPEAEAPAETVEVPAPDAEITEPKPAEVAENEPDFELEPEGIVTPELLTQMVTDNPEFGKLLESDARLKGQLYKTAREAAELKPYREIFPDLESAKSAVEAATTFNDVRETFMGSTTREGTIKTLAHLAELSYERDDQGNVLMVAGKPVLGEDFHGFLDNVVAIELEDKKGDIQKRLDANQYHVGVSSEEERDANIRADQQRIAMIDELLGQVIEAPETDQLPPALKAKAADIDRREKELDEKQRGEKVGERQKFDTEMGTYAVDRLNKSVASIIASVKKQGAVLSAYIEPLVAQKIASTVVAKIQANPVLQDQMRTLQSLPVGEDARKRRIAAVDRAFQMYLPDVAREELRAAGAQASAASAAKQAKVATQAANTKQTEPKGSVGAVTGGAAPMPAAAAFDAAQQEWVKANPGKPFDKIAKEMVLPRVLQLMGTR